RTGGCCCRPRRSRRPPGTAQPQARCLDRGSSRDSRCRDPARRPTDPWRSDAQKPSAPRRRRRLCARRRYARRPVGGLEARPAARPPAGRGGGGARAAGTLGITGPIRRDVAPGWQGERPLDPKADDWEPAVAADPAAPYVYTLHNRFGVHACKQCPDPAMILNVSTDGGTTFGPDAFICRCKGVGSQFDPEIEVVPDTGDVYAAWMNNFTIVFARSSDHGATWTAPVPVIGTRKWSDKPILATSADGQDVYVGFNGPIG